MFPKRARRSAKTAARFTLSKGGWGFGRPKSWLAAVRGQSASGTYEEAGPFYAISEVPWPSSMPARCDAAPYRPTMPISKVFAELASGVAQATGKPLTFARTTGRFV